MFTPLKNKTKNAYYIQLLLQRISARTRNTKQLCLIAYIIAPLTLTAQPTPHQNTTIHGITELIAGIAAPHLTPDTVLTELPAMEKSSTSVRTESCAGTSTLITPPATISSPGSYHLGNNGTGDITINAIDVCCSLNTYTLTGRVIINGANAKIINGIVTPNAAINNTEATQAAIEITNGATNTQLLDLTVTCLSLPDVTVDNPSSDLSNGRLAIHNAASGVAISGCTITAANGQAYFRDGLGSNSFDRTTGSGGIGILNSGSNLQVVESSIVAGSSGYIYNKALEVTIGAAIINLGGTGIYNQGKNLQVTNSTITAGSSGYIQAHGYWICRIASGKTLTINAGGAGIYNANTGIDLQVINSTITAGASGYIQALVDAEASTPSICSPSGSLTIGAGGEGIENSGTILQVLNSTVLAGKSGQVTI